MKRLWHTTCIYVTPPLQEYCEKLASLLPDPLKVRGACCLPLCRFGNQKYISFPLLDLRLGKKISENNNLTVFLITLNACIIVALDLFANHNNLHKDIKHKMLTTKVKICDKQ